MTVIQMSSTQRPTGTVVVPAYNESEAIRTSIGEIAAVLLTQMADRDWEIIIVDDGSVDETAARAIEAARAFRSPHLKIRILRHFGNRGLGAALQTGFGASTGDVVAVLDCDLSYHPEHIERMVHALVAEGAQVVVASPYMPGGRTVAVPSSLERRSRLANRFLGALSHSEVATFTGMVRAYDGPFIRALALRSPDDMINVEALYKISLLQGKIVEVPATLDWRGLGSRAGRTSLRSQRSRRKIYDTLVHGVLYRPYLPFALGGAVITVIGAVIGLFAAIMPGSQIGLTVLGVSIMIAGFTALLSSVLSVQVKRGLEDLFHQQSSARNHIRFAEVTGDGVVTEVIAARESEDDYAQVEEYVQVAELPVREGDAGSPVLAAMQLVPGQSV